MCINYNWCSFDSCRLHLSSGVEKKKRKLRRVVRLSGPEGGEGPTLKMYSFFWTFCKQILVLPVFSNSVASASLFYPRNLEVLGWLWLPSFALPLGGNHKFLWCYILTFITLLVQVPIISCWDCYILLFGLPVAAFIHSAAGY